MKNPISRREFDLANVKWYVVGIKVKGLLGKYDRYTIDVLALNAESVPTMLAPTMPVGGMITAIVYHGTLAEYEAEFGSTFQEE